MSIASIPTQSQRSDVLNGFDALNACHRQTQVALASLATLLATDGAEPILAMDKQRPTDLPTNQQGQQP